MSIPLSTLADQVGGCAALLRPLVKRIRAYVLAGARVLADDMAVPFLGGGKAATGPAWVYVRDGRPFGSCAPPAGLI